MYWGSWLSECVIPLTYCFFDLKSAVIITIERFYFHNFTTSPYKNFVSITSPKHNSLFPLLRDSLYSGCAAIKQHFLLIIRRQYRKNMFARSRNEGMELHGGPRSPLTFRLLRLGKSLGPGLSTGHSRVVAWVNNIRDTKVFIDHNLVYC